MVGLRATRRLARVKIRPAWHFGNAALHGTNIRCKEGHRPSTAVRSSVDQQIRVGAYFTVC